MNNSTTVVGVPAAAQIFCGAANVEVAMPQLIINRVQEGMLDGTIGFVPSVSRRTARDSNYSLAPLDKLRIHGFVITHDITDSAVRSPKSRIHRLRCDPLIYDFDWDEDARLMAWGTVVRLPPTLAVAIAAAA